MEECQLCYGVKPLMNKIFLLTNKMLNKKKVISVRYTYLSTRFRPSICDRGRP